MRLRDEHGLQVELSKVLGKGGEAEVWSVSTHTASVAKIYHVPSAHNEAKLRAMVAQPPADPTRGRGHVSICWPQALLFDPATNTNLGFLMPRIDLSRHRELFKIYNARTRQSEAPDFTWAYLVTAAENIASVLDSIHAKGYIVGDVNESNFFISSQALATIVDCDSMQVRTPSGTFHCTVAKPEYMAPELQGANLSKVLRTQPQDNFALAVLIFHLLMEGFHPYAGKWTKAGEAPSLEERIARGDSPYGSSSRISPSPGAPPIEILPTAIRELFVRAFYQGNRDPSRRPSAGEWQAALHTLGSNLSTCAVNPQHQYANHLNRCPWCERTVLLQGFDPFPSPHAQKILPNRPFQTVPNRPFEPRPAPPQQTVRRPAQTASAPTSPRFQATPRRAAPQAMLANRTFFRLLLFILPFLAALIGLILVPSSNLAALLLLRHTWLVATVLSLARRMQLRRSAQTVFALGLWLIFFYAIANLLGVSSLSGALSRSLAEAVLAFSASRSLLQLTRLRMDHYRLIGRTGRIAVVLVTAVAVAPLTAITPKVVSLLRGTAAAGTTAISHALSAAQPGTSPLVTLSTCANIVGRCGCTPKTAFHRGETVSLLALSATTPTLNLEVEPPGQRSKRILVSNWRPNGFNRCAVAQYRIPPSTLDGFVHLHLFINPDTPDQTASETGFSVQP